MEDEFNTSAEASETVPVRAGALKRNGTVVIQGRPCKVRSL
jgi:hypothetical protein